MFPMRRLTIGLAAAAALLATGALAQERDMRGPGGRDWGMMSRFSAEDIDAFIDARIAGLRVGLKLNPEQERLWAPVEEAIRNAARQRREQGRALRDLRGDERRDDLAATLRLLADQQSARAEALRRLADAVSPLYASLDDAQKRRFRVLARPMHRQFGMMRGMDRYHGPDRPWRG
jgi:zinc resistance-associated protein